ncbi:hypothetical protein ACP4OV_026141 [Aristida adscensionis]
MLSSLEPSSLRGYALRRARRETDLRGGVRRGGAPRAGDAWRSSGQLGDVEVERHVPLRSAVRREGQTGRRMEAKPARGAAAWLCGGLGFFTTLGLAAGVNDEESKVPY